MDLHDRRRSRRVPISSEVLLLERPGGGMVTCDAVDVSTAGMLVHPRDPVSTSRTLRIFFPLFVSGRERWIDLDAFQAREAREHQYGWGLMFLHLSFAASELLSSYVDETLGRIAMFEELAPSPLPDQSPR